MRITSERIASMRQYWRDGYSLPEIATMTKSTVATIRKYLKSDIQTYINEHEQAKARRADDTKDLSLNEFASYVTHEFSNAANDIISIKDVFYQLKNSEELNYEQVVRLRELYEARLNQLTSKETKQQTIKAFKNKHHIKIPIPRKANDWSEERLLEHLVFWLVANTESRAIAFGKLKELDTVDKRKAWLEQQTD